ncbi:MAG: thymidylate synthase [Firmicutes bacterium]|nr:thymidylate synthase [Bacillota bacterium]
MANFDKQYADLCEKIIEYGVRYKNYTGVDALKIFGPVLRFDLEKEFPLSTIKSIDWKNAILEMLWVYQAQSNDVRWLQERGIHSWDKWAASADGDFVIPGKVSKLLGKEFAHTVGTAYGWIIKKYRHTQRLIETLEKDPLSRQMLMSLWQDDYLKSATREVRVCNILWNVTGGRLNSIVTLRSSDISWLPFTVAQFATLSAMIAHVTGCRPGQMIVVISDAHVYVDQVDGIKKMIASYKEKGPTPAPKLWLNPDIKDFFAFDNSKELKDIKFEGGI